MNQTRGNRQRLKRTDRAHPQRVQRLTNRRIAIDRIDAQIRAGAMSAASLQPHMEGKHPRHQRPGLNLQRPGRSMRGNMQTKHAVRFDACFFQRLHDMINIHRRFFAAFKTQQHRAFQSLPVGLKQLGRRQ